MPRLTNLKPRLAGLPSRLGRVVGDEKARNRQRYVEQPWRAWYKTARWERLRRAAFLRDRYTCQRTGEICVGKGNDPNAPVAHHKQPHHGDPDLFWDIDNLETVAKHVHDGLIQAEERKAGL